MGWGLAAETQIGALVVRATGPDHQTAAQRLAGQLRAAQLAPAGLPPSAILCVRHLHDPRPGHLRLGGTNLSLAPPPGWQQAVRDELGTVARAAVRPAHDFVPANVAAVLFADQAELLGCLAADLARGDAGQHWWWRSLFGGQAPETALRQTWLAAPETLPASLEVVLARGGQQAVASVLARLLDDASAAQLLYTVCAVFGLAEVAQALSPGGATRPAPPWRPPVGRRSFVRGSNGRRHDDDDSVGLDVAVGADAASVPEPAPPWRAWVPECGAPGLRPAQQALLGIALLLRRAPSVPRQPRFAAAVQTWWLHATSHRSSPLPPADRRATAPVARAAAPRGVVLFEADAAPPRHAPDVPPSETMDAHRLEPRDADAPPQASATVAVSEATALASSDAAALPDRGVLAVLPDGAALAEDGSTSTVVITRLGGVFYLINVALALGLYGDFTQPARPGLPLPIWDYLSLVGQRLLGRQQLRSDPLWALLAALAGRTAPSPRRRSGSRSRPGRHSGAGPRPSAAPPGAGWRLPATWRLPPAWLEPLADDDRPWRWSVTAGRLRVWHPAGFCVLDRPVRSTEVTTARIAALLRPYGRPPVVHRPARGAPAADAPPTALARWVEWLVPYVRVRLRAALRTERGTDTDIGRLVCRSPARLVLTPVHLHVHLSLDRLPLAIRLAGLDRDPGWVPAAGRSIAFHFDLDDDTEP